MSQRSMFKLWSYPSEFEDPFWDAFNGMVGQIDASVNYLNVYDRGLMGGGGTISWSSGGGFGWSDDFVVPIFSSGFKVLLRYGPDHTTRSVALNDGECLYASVPSAISDNVVLNMEKTPLIGVDIDNVYVVAVRIGNELILRKGASYTF